MSKPEIMSATELNAYAEARVDLLQEMLANAKNRQQGIADEIAKLEARVLTARSQRMAAQEQLLVVHGTGETLRKLDQLLDNSKKSEKGEIELGPLLFMGGVVVVILIIGAFMAFGPMYRVWQQGMEGEAELSHANYSKQVAVQEAKAKLESATLLAQADVERAKGAAQANVILGNSLKGNEDYLRYLWIQGLENSKSAPSIIYVPTEAGLPILEAGHRQ